MKKCISTSDVTSWTFSVYVSMDSDPCETLLSDMRILTQLFINARAAIVSTILLVIYSIYLNLPKLKYIFNTNFLVSTFAVFICVIGDIEKLYYTK